MELIMIYTLRIVAILLTLYSIYTGYKILRIKEKYCVNYFRYRAVVLSMLLSIIFLMIIIPEMIEGTVVHTYKIAWIIYDILSPLVIIMFHRNTLFTILRENDTDNPHDQYATFLKWYRKNKHGKSGTYENK